MVVLSLGGSLIVNNDGVNTAYLKKFIALIKKEVKRGERFLIVCGGGATARVYDGAAAAINPAVKDIDLHWIGIGACCINAELLRASFGNLAPPRILRDHATDDIPKGFPVLVSGAGSPGTSSDGGAVAWAKKAGAGIVFNLTNIDGVYSADPRENKHAEYFSALTWKQYAKVLGMKTWKPNAHAPFDPIASAMAERWGLSAVILDGSDLLNFKRALEGKSFRGTTLSGSGI